MAEILGATASVVTLVGLLKGCITAFEVIRTVKDREKDLDTIDLKLTLEQCRLRSWGRSVGLVHEPGSTTSSNLLEGFEFQHVIERALRGIWGLLTDTNSLVKKYGAQMIVSGPGACDLQIESAARSPTSAGAKLAEAFKKMDISDGLRGKLKAAGQTSIWVLHDRRKGELLIDELRTLIDGVENVTKHLVSREQQQQLLISHITTISDVRSLQMITGVCEQDYPALSDAASARADALSTAADQDTDIHQWINDANFLDDSNEDPDSWDLPELRRRYVELRQATQTFRPLEPHSTASGATEADDRLSDKTKDWPNESDRSSGQLQVLPSSVENSTASGYTHYEIGAGALVQNSQEYSPGAIGEKRKDYHGEVSLAILNVTVEFLEKLQRRSQFSPEIYTRFLEAMKIFQQQDDDTLRAIFRVATILHSNLDFVHQLCVFIPTGWRLDIGLRQDQRNIRVMIGYGRGYQAMGPHYEADGASWPMVDSLCKSLSIPSNPLTPSNHLTPSIPFNPLTKSPGDVRFVLLVSEASTGSLVREKEVSYLATDRLQGPVSLAEYLAKVSDEGPQRALLVCLRHLKPNYASASRPGEVEIRDDELWRRLFPEQHNPRQLGDAGRGGIKVL